MKSVPSRNRDLLRYLRRKKLVRSLLAALWTVLLVSGAVAYNNAHRTYPPERLMIGWKFALLCVIAVVSGILIFRLPKLFLDRSFEGVIERSGLSHSYTRSADPGSSEYNFRLNTVLRVRTPDGKKKRIRFEQKNGFFVYYHEGKRVCHFAGLPYPLADLREPNDPPPHASPIADAREESPLGNYLCVACGRLNRAPDVCDGCGLSVIDPKDVFGEKPEK